MPRNFRLPLERSVAVVPVLATMLVCVLSIEARCADAEPVAAVAKRSIAQLNDPSYDVRQSAESKLVALGIAAKPALTSAIKTGSPHVSDVCQRILERLIADDFRRRLKEFEEGGDPLSELAWKRFREQIGDSEAHRKAFSELMLAEPELFLAYTEGLESAAEAVSERFARMLYRPRTYLVSIRQPTADLESMLAMIFLLCDPRIDPASVANDLQQVLSNTRRHLKEITANPIYREILDAGLMRLAGTQNNDSRVYSTLSLAASLNCEQATLKMAASILSGRVKTRPQYFAAALGAVGSIHKEKSIPALQSFLHDHRIVTGAMKRGSRQYASIQVSDIAAFWIARSLEIPTDEHWATQVKNFVKNIERSPHSAIHYSNYRLKTDDERPKLIAKIEAKLKSRPYPVESIRPVVTPKATGSVKYESQRTSFTARAKAAPEPDYPIVEALIARQLGRAAAAIEDGDLQSALAVLSSLQKAGPPEALVFESPRVFRTLVVWAENLFLMLSPDELRQYQILFGATGKAALQQATNEGPSAIADVAIQYPYTEAGLEALVRLSLHLRDRGEFSEALILARRAERMDDVMSGEERPSLPAIVADLEARGPLGGTGKRLDRQSVGEADPNKSRNPYLVTEWSKPFDRSLRSEYHSAQGPNFASVRPGIGSEVVAVARTSELSAFDTTSGEHMWTAQFPQRELRDLGASSEASWNSLPKWCRLDPLSDAVVHDGHRIYATADRFEGLGPLEASIIVNRSGRVRIAWPSEERDPELRAYDAVTGRLAWSLGRSSDRAKNEPQGRIISPPAVSNYGVLVVTETESETRLILIDPESGRQTRSWPIALPLAYAQPSRYVYRGIPAGLQTRRLAAPTVDKDYGVAAAPDGQFACIDFALGAVRWSRNVILPESPTTASVRRISGGAEKDFWVIARPDRWISNRALITGETILLTAIGSDELIAVNATNGESRWTIRREDGIDISVHGDRLIIVGRRTVRLFDLADGTPTQVARVRLGRRQPSGPGAVYGKDFYLPFDSGEIGRVALFDGSLAVLASDRPLAGPTGLFPLERGLLVVDTKAVSEFQPANERDGNGPAGPSWIRSARVAQLAGDPATAIDLLHRTDEDSRTPEVDRTRLKLLASLFAEQTTGFDQQFDRFCKEIAAVPELCATLLHTAAALQSRGAQDELARLLSEVDPTEWTDLEPIRRAAGYRIRPHVWLKKLRQHVEIESKTTQISSSSQEPVINVPAHDWPARLKVDAEQKPDAVLSRSITSQVAIRNFYGDGSPVIAVHDPRQRKLNVRDGKLRSLFEAKLPTPAARISNVDLYARLPGVQIDQVLAVARGDAIFALDLSEKPVVDSETEGENRILWKADRWDAGRQPLETTLLSGVLNQNRARPRVTFWPIAANAEAVFFQQSQILRAVDPQTGQVRWERDDFDSGCDLLVSRGRLVVSPPLSERAYVLDALDGSLLREVSAVPFAQRRQYYDGLIVRVVEDGPERCVGLYDPVTEAYVWKKTLEVGTCLDADASRLYALNERGQLQLIDLAEGDVEAVLQTEGLEDFVNLHVISGGATPVLLVEVPDQSQDRRINNRYNRGSVSAASAICLGIDTAKGKLAWSKLVKAQSALVDQPTGLPFVFFCGRYSPITVLNGRTSIRSAKYSSLMLDRRSGAVLHKHEQNARYNVCYRYEAAEDGLIEVRTSQERLVVRAARDDEPVEAVRGAASP
ncbi:outer membrane protein assembly factor BamB family protein [Stratiformator vulcanicus]|uniref:Outer membrane protein assembly factor BamB n=1 Tax=Stratiformator vulcanicus TaxID=2527980 RepID=A0A517QX51_9PLAN|nr:PQQ-binding-like beta-propeller repeat protein [Stratiformator vulcanicus]QDT36242.1 Outer membrane protein assembly factor BamB [Stratiformator vulcanicus]